MSGVIDADQHLYEFRTLWADLVDPSMRSDALGIVDDDLGYAWLTWRGRRLDIADVPRPGDTRAVGRHRARFRRGEPPEYRYDDALPDDYWSPSARIRQLDSMGINRAVVFPNFGLLWERRLSESLPALTANMGAWNRWCASVASESAGRLLPVAHLTLRDPEWLETQLEELSSAGVCLAMIAPASVDGRPLSHPDHDRIWSAFVDHGVTPVFHVADQPRVIDDAFYAGPSENLVSPFESVFIWAPPAVAVTDLIINGTFARHPGLRIGIFELSSIWVPQYLLMLDGGWDFTTALNGRPLAELDMRPSEYFLERVRVASFSYELPVKLTAKSGDIFMCCSDYPHSEGTATLIEDYGAIGTDASRHPGIFHRNVEHLIAG